MNGAHICMSGSLDCSGIDPCERCSSAIVTYVLVPAMKAAQIDQRNDPRVMRFLQTYAEARKAMVASVVAQVAAAQPPPPMPPPPSIPPVADLPLTAAELEAMASPVDVPPVVQEEPAMAGGPEVAPPGLMSDDEFKSRFPTIPPETVMDVPPPTVAEEPSLMKLAAQAITPKLPADKLETDTEVGIAPTEPPSPASQPKALTDDVSAVAESAHVQADSSTKAEASSHG